MGYSFTYGEVFAAFDDCLKHKKNSPGAMKFRVNEVDNLIRLTDEINSFKYQISTSEAFMITDPKLREVFAANFRDRIVHHLVVSELKPFFEEYFIPHTFACLEGRGILAGVKTLATEIDTKSNHYTTPFYLAKLDFKAFFMSIDKYLLYRTLDKFIIERYPNNRKKLCLRFLCRQIILHHPELDCRKVGNLNLWKRLPKYKSLFHVGTLKGLAIGNLTSQMFANFFLTPLDYYVTKELGLEIHVRYADDFVIGHHSKEYLKLCIPKIKRFVEQNWLLSFHPDKLYFQECHKGVSFIGAIIRPNRIYCSNRSIAKFYKKLHDQQLKSPEALVASINSYLGLLAHYKTYHIRKALIKKLLSVRFGKGFKKVTWVV